MGDPAEVVALVLTHDAPDSLSRCLHALAAQTRRPDRVVVLDNASSSPTTIPRSDLPTSVLRSTINSGPAGGWADLMRAGAATTAGWLWLLDDDVAPATDCLEHLLAESSNGSDIVVQPRVWEEVSQSWRTWPAWLGPLLPRQILSQVGLPREELVWWAEDSEYLHVRLGQCGYRLTLSQAARVSHSMTRRGPTPRWKSYYEARNSVWLRIRVRQQYSSPKHLARLAKVLGRLMMRAAQSETPVRDIAAVGTGAVHGLLPRMGVVPAFVDQPGSPRWEPSRRIESTERVEAGR